MSAIFRSPVTFSGILGTARYTPATATTPARLNASVYDRTHWTDKDGTKHEGPWETVEVTYWGKTAERLAALRQQGALPQKSAVVGTGKIDAELGTWLGRDDGKPYGRIRIDGQTLTPDIVRDSYRQQAADDQRATATADDQQEPEGWGPNATTQW
jgi:hypothetical protein